jgi:hypothetical protein
MYLPIGKIVLETEKIGTKLFRMLPRKNWDKNIPNGAPYC